MRITTEDGVKNVAVVIPSKGRPALIAGTFRRQSFLNDDGTFVGIENCERELYAPFLERFSHVTPVYYDNPIASAGLARERIRRHVISKKYNFDVFVQSDDGMEHTQKALANLVRCCVEFPEQPTVVAGYHPYMAFKLRNCAPPRDLRTINGIRSFEGVSTLFVAYSYEVYSSLFYPDDVASIEDIYVMLWCLEHGISNLRICVDAPAGKDRSLSRSRPGGCGTSIERQIKRGKGLMRLGRDFPRFMGDARFYMFWYQWIDIVRAEKRKWRPKCTSKP